jgi:hypothetical protein
MLVGRDPGTVGEEAGTIKALLQMGAKYGNDESIEGLRKTVRVLAVQVLSHNANEPRAQEVARKLFNIALAPCPRVLVP